ncbi:MAG: F0F1 ATP synthase subunit delta [Parcubacteria group bacterium]|nr:F0F1 ATP synthase subunit delta [Parcubacteria group bacterium]MBI2175228.1 F0F1 ATP synthase subunit delta [Parcubacteria group bacterium]
MTYTPDIYARALCALACERKLDAAAISRFLRLARKHRDFSGLPQIFRLFRTYYDNAAKTARIEVTIARDSDYVVGKLKKRLGKNVVIEKRVRPELIAGVHLRVNDVIVIDATARRQLQRMFQTA